jgi:branched-chain amino acid transport system substrate-binding protein
MHRILARLLVLAVLLAPVAAQSAGQPPYEINVVVSQTGPAAFIGASESKMLGILETTVNKQGGIKGRPVKFLINDDQSNPVTAVQFVTRFATDKVPVILGPGFVATCAASMPVTVKNGPLTWCFAPGIYPPAGSYVLSTGATIDDTILVVARYCRERGWKRIAVVATTDASGQAFDHGVQSALSQPESKDLILVDHEHFNPTDLSADAQLVRIKAAKPDVVFALATGTPFGTALRSMANAGLNVPIVGGNGNMIMAQLGQYAAFMPREMYFPGTPSIATGAVLNGPIKDAQAVYFKAFQDAGIKPDLGYNIAWDPTMLLIDALRTIGPGATAQQLRDYIVNLHGWAGINGIYDFRDGAQRGVGARAIVMVRWDKEKQQFEPMSRPAGYLK